MARKIVLWVAALALVSGSALKLAAQEGPGDDDAPEMAEGGPGPHDMEPGMEPGLEHDRGPEADVKGDRGRERKFSKTRKTMREGREERGPGFMPEAAVLGLIKKHDPAFFGKLKELRETAPGKYRIILQLSGKLFGMVKEELGENLEKDAVRALSLEFDSKELALGYDKASDAEKKSVRESLRGKLAELFDLKTRAHELRLKRMEKEIAKLRKNLESRKLNKEKIVQQRLEQLTGEGYGW